LAEKIPINKMPDKSKSFRSISECRKHYNILFNRVSDAVLLLDDFIFIECNPKALELFSCERYYIVGKSPIAISATEQSYDKSYNLFKSTYYEEALRGNFVTFLWDFLKPNGTIVNTSVQLEGITMRNKPMVQAIIEEISESTEFKRKILNAIIDTQEKERKRFAEDLHDGLGPLLSSIKIYVNLISAKKIDDHEKQNLVQYTNELIDEAIRSTKEISNNLMPNLLADYGLLITLKSFFKKINITGLLEIEFETDGCTDRFDQQVEISLYRIILELINNTLKHANAKNVYIKLNRQDSKISLSYTDDGIGFNVSKIISKEMEGMGINNIYSRVESLHGVCDYISEKGKGTCVKIDFNI
jgi:signal transduction histidine kinase